MGDRRSTVGLRNAVLVVELVLGVVTCTARPAWAGQGLSNIDRDRGCTMLKVLKAGLEKYYYDPTFRGMDLDARFKQADERVKQAKSLSDQDW